MYLKSLELTGFKSFAEKTVIEFNKGITSIVGPNGSGKSNILDAILWVLGEQSYKNIRAKESSDVIFSGGKNRKSRSMAEVSLIIDNGDKYLDIDFSEVKITRRIYKNGENEYLINNRKTRLKDINNLFMDTGIGKQAYSIIGQGKVERIVSSNPREIKEIIEEAAGIKRAKTEKEDSLKRLKEVKDEIEKIEYVETDLANRVEKLKEDSLKARLYKNYTEKIEIQKYMILEYDINEKLILKKDFTEKWETLEKENKLICDEFEENKNKLSETSKEKDKKYGILEDEKGKNKEILLEIEKMKDNLSLLNNKLSNLEIEKREKGKRSEIISLDLLEKGGILEKSKEEYEKIKEDFLIKERERVNLSKKVEELKEKKVEILENLKKLKDQNQNYEVDKIKLHHENQDLEKRILGANRESKRLYVEREGILKEFKDIGEKMEKFEENKGEYESKLKNQRDNLQNLRNEIGKQKGEYDGVNGEKNTLQYKLGSVMTKYKTIENIIENNENFQRGAKYLLKEKFNGIIGGFINLIEIPLGYEVAFQTLAGSYFQDIVVENSKIAQNLIEILKEKKLGRASFLPLDTLKSFKLMEELPKEEGIIGFSRNLVKYDEKIKKVVEFIFGNSVIVENLEKGRILAKKGFGNKIVTLEGDVISSGGRITGGQTQKFKDETLEKKRELNLLREEGKKMRQLERELEEKGLKLREKLEEKKGELKKLEEEEGKLKEKYREFLGKYEDFNRMYLRKENQLKTLNYEIDENEKFIGERNLRIKTNEDRYEEIKTFILENEKIINELEKELNSTENLDDYNGDLTKINTEYEILKVKMENNQSRFLEIERDYKKLELENESINKFQRESENIKGKLLEEKELKIEEIINRESENNEVGDKILELEENIRKLEEIERENITKVKDIEVKIVNYKNEREKLEEKINKNNRELEYYENEIGEMKVDRIRESSLYSKIEDSVYLQSTRRKLAMDEKSRQEIGNVNLLSIEEYERESERYESLVDQKRDLISSRESLLSLIKDIESQIVDNFSIAFKEINKNFEYMCNRILNGAKGMLKMTNENDILDTGLELSVKYKNKPEQTLMLLSGGEKSMLAVSFIMAIFMYKPSPFTFFDEIEAALDESNTKKIVELLNEFIEKSQFILITHNKETMKGSHRLYGVTMNKEIGESKLIAVDI